MPILTKIQLELASQIEENCPQGWSIRTWFEAIPGGTDAYYYVGIVNHQNRRIGYYCIDPFGTVEETWP